MINRKCTYRATSPQDIVDEREKGVGTDCNITELAYPFLSFGIRKWGLEESLGLALFH